MALYSIKFTVYPVHKLPNPFPIDMLRYDHCYPSTEGDANILQRTIEHVGEGFSCDDLRCRVTLVHIDRYRTWEPTHKRWESFGWKVDFPWTDIQKVNS